MTALLRADWLRFRRRRDVWFIALGVCVIAAVVFLSGYRQDATDPPPFDEAAFVQELRDSGFFEGMTQADLDAQLPILIADRRAGADQERAQHEAEQGVALQKYAFPQSLLTVLGGAYLPIGAAILIASLTVGDEFRFGTIRTSLLAASNRRRFLVARLLSLAAVAAGLILAQLAIGAALGIGLAAAGADLGQHAPINALAVGGFVLIDFLAMMTLVVQAVAVTLILRSGALTPLLAILALVVEAFLTALPIFGSGQPLAALPQFFLTTSLRNLQGIAGRATGGIAIADVPAPPGELRMDWPALVAVVAGWALLYLSVADWRIRRMDIVE